MRTALRLLLLLCLPACDRALDTPNGPYVTPPATTPTASCASFTDEASCHAAGCSVEMCPGCDGQLHLQACSEPGPTSTGAEGEPCPLLGCSTASACSALTDAASCQAKAGCYVLYGALPACSQDGGCQEVFVSCGTGVAQCTPTTPDLCGDDSPGPNCLPGYTAFYSSDDCASACVSTESCADRN